MYTPAATLTVDNAHLVLKEGVQAIAAGQHHIDMAATTTVDSAAVAVLLTWQRHAKAQGVALELRNMSANLQSLASLYGAAALLQTGN
jgi:phospholipid transport system transporter-binding protein